MFADERIAVIGAGLAGCLVARQLADRGGMPEVFEKSRGTGGRLAAARLGGASADLGAALIDSKAAMHLLDARAQLPLEQWPHKRSDMKLMTCAEEEGWVPMPRASSLTRALLEGVPLYTETRIVALEEHNQGGWWLHTEAGEKKGPYARVVLAVPAPQAVPLLAASDPLQRAASSARMTPSWVSLLELPERPVKLDEVDVLEGDHPILARICRDSSKPGRSGEIWQLQANTRWSEQYVDADPGWVGQQLIGALSALLGESVKPDALRVHRWLYSNVESSQKIRPVSSCGSLAVCGDWVCGQGILAAVESANLLIRALETNY